MSNKLEELTPTPPMGWNSYDSFGCCINEKYTLENLEVFASQYKPDGYEYTVWNPSSDGRMNGASSSAFT